MTRETRSMHRRLAPSSLVLLLALGCEGGGGAVADGGSDAAPSTGLVPGSESGDATCFPGYETCPCFEGGLCLDDLQCLSGLCVEIRPDASTGEVEVETSSTTSPDDESSSGAPLDTSTDSSSSDESSTTEAEPVCFDGDTFCPAGDEQILICIEGQWLEQSCEENSAITGHTGTECSENQQECVWDGFSDDDCELDVEVLCVCYFEDLLDDECTADQKEEFYQWCFQETDPVVACFGSYYDPNVGLDCAGAIDNCL